MTFTVTGVPSTGRPLFRGARSNTAYAVAFLGFRVLYTGVFWTIEVNYYVIGSPRVSPPYTIEFNCYYTIVDFNP